MLENISRTSTPINIELELIEWMDPDYRRVGVTTLLLGSKRLERIMLLW